MMRPDSRVVFENTLKRLTAQPELYPKVKELMLYMHKWESDYGDLSRVIELEKRMADLFPDDPKLSLFSSRFSSKSFDPVAAPIIVSPTQIQPKKISQSIEPISLQNSPRPMARMPASPRVPLIQATNSPKRPFPLDDFEDLNPPRKMQRGESPILKGAAGRRMAQLGRTAGQGPVSTHGQGPPPPLPTMLSFLLGQLPNTNAFNAYGSPRLDSGNMVRLLQNVEIKEGARGVQGRSHGRQSSKQYGRNSPRPASPMINRPTQGDSRGRLTAASATYSQQLGRPESRGWEEAAAAMGGMPPGAPPQQYPTGPPPPFGIPTPVQGWQAPPPAGVSYGVPPPGTFAPPPQFGQAPPPAQPPYGNYQY